MFFSRRISGNSLSSFMYFTYMETIIGHASLLLFAATAEKTMCHPIIYFFHIKNYFIHMFYISGDYYWLRFSALICCYCGKKNFEPVPMYSHILLLLCVIIWWFTFSYLNIISFICFKYLEIIIGHASLSLLAGTAEKTFGPMNSYKLLCDIWWFTFSFISFTYLEITLLVMLLASSGDTLFSQCKKCPWLCISLISFVINCASLC